MAGKRPLTKEERQAAATLSAALQRAIESQEAIGAKVGVSQGMIWQWANARLPVPAKRAQALAAAVGVDDPGEISPAWRDMHRLVTMEPGAGKATSAGRAFLESLRPPVGESVQRLTVAATEIPPGYVRLPQYAAEVSAGGGTVVDESDLEVVCWLDVAERWAKQHLPRDLSRVRVLGVRGDSMAPDIQHDDVVFVDTATKHFDAPGLYVLNWQGRALVKRLVPEMRTGRLQIVSNNPAYPTEYVEPGEIDQLHIGGRVAAWWTLRKF